VENSIDTVATPEDLTSINNVDEKICLIPSKYFFIDCIEVAEEITESEKSDFLILQIEGLSPFPIDQILWGYFALENTDHYLVYAALKDRLTAEDYDLLANFTWVIPSFVPKLLLERPTQEPSSVIQSLSMAEDSHPYEMRLTKDRALVVSKNQIKTESDAEAIPESERATLTSDQLWSADIRPIDFKSKEQKNRSRLGLINRALKYSLIFFCLLLISEVSLLIANTWLTSYASKIELQSPIVRVIEDQHSLINKLEQISQNELRPVALLEKANQVRSQTNSNIIYDAVEINGANAVTIKGTAGSVNQFNSYVTQLTNSKFFKISEDPKYVTRGGKTTFTLKMDYKHSEKSF